MLQQVQQYLPTIHEDEEIKFAEQGIVGDQLKTERAVNRTIFVDIFKIK